MRSLRIFVPGIFTVAALALAMSAGAQTTAVPGSTPEAKSPQAAHMKAHHPKSVAGVKHTEDMKAECEAMMARRQDAQAKLEVMDARLDKLVAEMNAAKGSKEVDAMEKPMAAVLNELVVQRKALQTMMMEMQPAMMAHMAHHMHGAKGAMDCPMMKMEKPAEPKTGEKKSGK